MHTISISTKNRITAACVLALYYKHNTISFDGCCNIIMYACSQPSYSFLAHLMNIPPFICSSLALVQLGFSVSVRERYYAQSATLIITPTELTGLRASLIVLAPIVGARIHVATELSRRQTTRRGWWWKCAVILWRQRRAALETRKRVASRSCVLSNLLMMLASSLEIKQWPW